MSPRLVGLVLGLGSGALIGAVAYELVDEASSLANGSGRAAAGLALGAVASYVVGGNWRGGAEAVSDRRLLTGAALDVGCESIVIVGSLLAGHGDRHRRDRRRLPRCGVATVRDRLDRPSPRRAATRPASSRR